MPTTNESLTTCPHCGYEQHAGRAVCGRCRVVFGELPPDGSGGDPLPLPHDTGEDVLPPSRVHPDRGAWISLAIGAVGSLLAFVVSPVRWMLGSLVTLIHEMGHALVGWLLGHPSVPAFDFTYGGGVTLHHQRSTALLLLVYAGFAWLAFRYRDSPRARNAILAGAVVHALLVFPFAGALGSGVVLASGHGMELLIAGIFLYRCISKVAVAHAVERVLYALLGFYVVVQDIAFSFALLTDRSARQAYEAAKGGGHVMDFSRLARQFTGGSLDLITLPFLATAIATPVAAYLVYHHRARIERGFDWLLQARR